MIRGTETDPVRDLWRSWAEQFVVLVAPVLLRYEVTNAFRRLLLSGSISHDEARDYMQAALTLPIQMHAQADLHLSALDLAVRFTLPATYDAQYLALAERLGIDFYTGDRRLWHTVRQQLPWVRLVDGN